MPLLSNSTVPRAKDYELKPLDQVEFKNFNDKEEATCMKSVTMLRFSSFKTYLFLPILSLLTLFVLPIRMYWSATLSARYKYSHVSSVSQTTDLLIHGRDGNIEIVKLQNLTDRVRSLLSPERALSLLEHPFYVSAR